MNYVRELEVTLSALGGAAVSCREIRDLPRAFGRLSALRGLEWRIKPSEADDGRYRTFRLPVMMIGRTGVRVGTRSFHKTELDLALEHLTRSVVSRFYRTPNRVFELRRLSVEA